MELHGFPPLRPRCNHSMDQNLLRDWVHGGFYVVQVVFRHHEPPKPTCLEVFMVNNLVFRWPKPLFFMVLGAHGII